MRIHRIHSPQPLEPGQEAILENGLAHYIGRVLRVAEAQTVILFNGDGHDYVAEVLAVGKREVALAVNSRLPAKRESRLKITVVQALSRGERMDQTLQKCTELGVTAFQPLFSERVEVRLKAGQFGKKLNHWRSVVISACEQSGRGVVPDVFEPLDLTGWLKQVQPGGRIVLAPGAERSLAGSKLPDQIELAIGPEGGFSDTEVKSMQLHGVQAASLGPRVLRTETAAPAAVAVIQAMAGDLS